ncbi:acyloxyacyl hydrolase [Phenylobacterium sp.]|uniref:acyloxyacyl hydrolase n=1 Tax=Phenylobacterium sp. TaxID=1871053 RepID=UPI002DEAFD25|nr:acyloxyacyl hydrolase [Phenylobacterium sp.]
MRSTILCLAAGLSLIAGAASAGEVFVGAYDHDVHIFAIGGFEHGAELSAGYRTSPLDGLSIIGRPSAYGFGAANTSGGLNYAAAGFSWRFGDQFYLRPGIGVGVHNGTVGKFQVGNELNLGSRVLAELELGAGWQFSPKMSVEASLVHMSHARLAGKQNPGLDDVGLRFNYRF